MTAILSDYIDRPTLASELQVSERTIWRYEQLPNGLPSLKIGGRKLYRRTSVMAWIAAREVSRNPRRAA